MKSREPRISILILKIKNINSPSIFIHLAFFFPFWGILLLKMNLGYILLWSLFIFIIWFLAEFRWSSVVIIVRNRRFFSFDINFFNIGKIILIVSFIQVIVKYLISVDGVFQNTFSLSSRTIRLWKYIYGSKILHI